MKQKTASLLFDMDGVLAEVSRSYRASIIATCRAHGATSVTLDTVSEWKARGGCNNDWKLSLDLIKSDPNGDQSVTLEQVTDTFERIYQGTPDTKGLCELETLIPSMETMEELRRRCKHMAIVTGRPRKDCDKFLKLHNLDRLFDATVCMEDGPPKPDPFPVRRACELLGISPGESVLMVGDTPDDIRSALAINCRAVGVTTPEAFDELKSKGESHEKSNLALAMQECGAEAILEPGFSELLNMV